MNLHNVYIKTYNPNALFEYEERWVGATTHSEALQIVRSESFPFGWKEIGIVGGKEKIIKNKPKWEDLHLTNVIDIAKFLSYHSDYEFGIDGRDEELLNLLDEFYKRN